MNRQLKEVTIEVIKQCNSNCIFCSSLSTSSSAAEIPLQKVIEIIDFCKKKRAKSISISGGEPLLYANLSDVIRYCSQNAINTTIYTSGNVYKNEWNAILKSNLDKEKVKFIFNYPSVQNDIYQKLIHSKKFDIDMLNSKIKDLVRKGFLVEVHTVPNKANLHSLFDTAAYLKSICVNKVSFLRLVMQGRAAQNQNLLFVDSSAISSEISKIKKQLSSESFTIRGGVPFSNLLKEKCECFAGISKLIFRYDGVVFPCEAFKEAPSNEEFQLGSIYLNSLDSIWNNHPVHQKLKLLKQDAFSKLESCPAQILYG